MAPMAFALVSGTVLNTDPMDFMCTGDPTMDHLSFYQASDHSTVYIETDCNSGYVGSPWGMIFGDGTYDIIETGPSDVCADHSYSYDDCVANSTVIDQQSVIVTGAPPPPEATSTVEQGQTNLFYGFVIFFGSAGFWIWFLRRK